MSSIYPLTKAKKDPNLLRGKMSFTTEERAREMYQLYLSDELTSQDHSERMLRRYRLHALKPHSIEMALQYDIDCPKCGSRLKLVGRQLDYYNLGLYACPVCDKN